MIVSYCRHKHSRPDPQAPALEVRDLCAGYRSVDQPALRNINMSVPVGASLALVGANGAGKSTLFKVISGLVPLVQGTVQVFGHALGQCHQRVVYLPQRSEIDWHFPMSVLDLVLTGRYVYLGWFRRPRPEDVKLALDALQQLGIRDLAGRHIHNLSGGQQQRVLIARALVQNADLLLLDEPLNAIDAETRQTVAQVLRGIKEAGRTVIVATHHFDQEEGLYDSAIYLKDGERVAPDTPCEGPHCDH